MRERRLILLVLLEVGLTDVSVVDASGELPAEDLRLVTLAGEPASGTETDIRPGGRDPGVPPDAVQPAAPRRQFCAVRARRPEFSAPSSGDDVGALNARPGWDPASSGIAGVEQSWRRSGARAAGETAGLGRT